jgi:hypothetical protein
MDALEPLNHLRGSWRLTRNFRDRRNETAGIFEGLAIFGETAIQDPEKPSFTLHYREAGRLQFGTFDGPAQRELLFTSAESSLVRITYVDGRPFLDVDFVGGVGGGCHSCGDDRYEITFDFRLPDALEETWRVRGPSKNYDATTIMTRVLQHRIAQGVDTSTSCIV